MPDDIQPTPRQNKNLNGPKTDKTSASEGELAAAFPGGQSKLSMKSKVLAWWRAMSKNKRFALISLVLLVFATGAIGYFYFIQPAGNPSIQITRKSEPPKPQTVASPLTGIQVSPELAARPVTGIMIENSPSARPQSGIEQAGVIYEAIAEGGITRFLTLYQEAQPQYVGPVRSLRPYYLDFLVPFDGSIAHAGGSPEALAQVRGGMKDLDQFLNSGAYWRVSSRAGPHNLYTSFERLDALNKAKGYTTSKVASWPRKDEMKLGVSTAKIIDLAISSASYLVHYDYDVATNSYLRSEGGAPHNSTTSEGDKVGQQLKPKVVVALVMPYSLNGKYSVYGTTGSGQMFVFQDGGVTAGTWTKAGRGNQFVFTDAAEKPIKLNPGQTWVTVLAIPSKITYAP